MNIIFWSRLLFTFSSLASGFPPFFIKIASSKKLVSYKMKSFFSNILLVFVGLGIYGFVCILEILALKQVDLSILYPFAGLTYISSIVVGMILLKEKITKSKFLALSLIFCGILLTQIQ